MMEYIFSDEDLAACFKHKRGTLAVVCDSDSDLPWTESKLEALRVDFIKYTPASDETVFDDFMKSAVKHGKGIRRICRFSLRLSLTERKF